jgi:hypothetical protein
MTVPAELPATLRRLLDGERLEERSGLAFELVTVSAEGWPHVALLSVGELIATGADELRLALWESSGTSANLRRTGQALLALVHDGAYFKLRLEAEPDGEADAGRPLTTFRARVVELVEDRVPYAELTSGIEFSLSEPDHVVRRWGAVVEELRGG